MSIFSNYKFTKKKHPTLGIMSTILGVISLASVILAIYIPYVNRIAISPTYGMTCLLGLVMASVGLVLAIICIYQKDTYSLFPTGGIILNGITIVICAYIIYLGAYGA